MRRSELLKASPPMFRSTFLDRFTRVHWLVPVVIYLPLIAIMLTSAARRDQVWAIAGLFAVGYLLWTLLEYWAHRLVFHFEPKNPLGARFHWMIHGVHHDHPNDALRLVLPPAVSLPIGLGFLTAFFLVVGPIHAPALSAGFMAGYLIYDELHYFLHHGRPRARLARKLRELHMRHHFQSAAEGFGVSAPYWDMIFRTRPRGSRS